MMPLLGNVLAQVLIGTVIGVGVSFVLTWVLSKIDDWVEDREHKRKTAIEAELDRTQAELRQTIFQLASSLNGDAHEARKALIRESYLARGEVPKD